MTWVGRMVVAGGVIAAKDRLVWHKWGMPGTASTH